jgi:hypothetical protein
MMEGFRTVEFYSDTNYRFPGICLQLMVVTDELILLMSHHDAQPVHYSSV